MAAVSNAVALARRILVLMVALSGVALPASAKQEYREPVWTWSLYTGDSNLATQGDFNSPNDIATAFNGQEDANYGACAGVNCGHECIKHSVPMPTEVGPYPIINGQGTYLYTQAGSTTSYAPACISPNGAQYPAGGPWVQSPDQAVMEGMMATLHCPEGADGWTLKHGPTNYVTIGGVQTATYSAWCERTIPDPPACDCDKWAVPKLPPRTFGNPIDAVGGAKIEPETDYSAADGLTVSRFYSSLPGHWVWTPDASLADFTGRTSHPAGDLISTIHVKQVIDYSVSAVPMEDRTEVFHALKTQPDAGQREAWVFDERGGRVVFTEGSPGVFTSNEIEKPELTVQTNADGPRWLYRSPSWGYLQFDANGALLRRVQMDGKGLVFARDTSSITETALLSGRSVVYSNPVAGALDVALPGGRHISYSVDSAQRVLSVTYPDQSQRSYLYGESAYTGTSNSRPMWLTGLVDENQIRTGTYSYDGVNPLATMSGSGLNKYQFNISASSTVVTTPLGTSSTMTWENGPDGEPRVTSETQGAGAGSNTSKLSITYESSGNVASIIDFDSHLDCYTYNASRNLETTRVEGLSNTAACSSVLPSASTLPAGSRKTSTQWHPDWRLATKVAEPGAITTNIYNGQPDPFNANAVASCAPSSATLPDGKPIAVLCKKVIQATTDTDGSQAFNAPLDTKVSNRIWTYTYNQYGQALTAKGPRTDVNDTTTYAYYGDTTSTHTIGDLQTVTDALGHVTAYTQYDAYGNVLEKVDANQVATDYTYDARQRLKTVKVGSQTTSYDYWPTGLLKQVTFPDASYVAYSYDDAHRLTDVSDSSGNSVHYVLDNAGNRTAEQYKDLSGALKSELDRIYDALGRVQQSTGRE
jgi:YD repeat-containing protein